MILCISLAPGAPVRSTELNKTTCSIISYSRSLPRSSGARAFYVIFNFDNYKDNWKSIFDYWEGGLAVYGGVIAALLAAFFVARHKKQSFLKIAGFAAPYIILGQAIGRWGNFFNQEAFGGPTKMPWG